MNVAAPQFLNPEDWGARCAESLSLIEAKILARAVTPADASALRAALGNMVEGLSLISMAMDEGGRWSERRLRAERALAKVSN